jgi:hypothetical protein
MGRGELGIGRGRGGSGAARGGGEEIWEGPEAGGGADGDVVALAGAVGVCGEEGLWGRAVHGAWIEESTGQCVDPGHPAAPRGPSDRRTYPCLQDPDLSLALTHPSTWLMSIPLYILPSSPRYKNIK